jgi:antitoxin Phd
MPDKVSVWRRLLHAMRPSLKQLLLTDLNRVEFAIPKRGSAKRRSPPV